jgi:hypothetical protein
MQHPMICALLAWICGVFRSRQSLRLENVALRRQLAVYQRAVPRPHLGPTRPPVQGLALSLLVRLAGCLGLRPATYGGGLAAQTFP